MKHNIQKYYPDMLSNNADLPTFQLVRDLDTVCTAPQPPAHLTFEQVLRNSRQQDQPQMQALRERRLFTSRPQRIRVLLTAAVLIVVALSAAAIPAFQIMLDKLLQTEAQLPLSAYADIHQSKTVNGYTVTVEKVYADANRILVVPSFTAPNKASNQVIETPDAYVVTDKGEKLIPGVNGTIGSDEATNAQHQTISASTLSFDASPIQGHPKQLRLHLVLKGLYFHTNSDGLRPDGTYEQVIPAHTITAEDISFDFTVPFHPGRIATPHQALTVNGRTLTLERIVVTPSETHLYVRGLYGLNDTEVKVFGEHANRTGSAVTDDCLTARHTDIPKDYNVTCIVSISIAKNYFDQEGKWNIDILANGSTWKFNFSLPKAD